MLLMVLAVGKDGDMGGWIAMVMSVVMWVVPAVRTRWWPNNVDGGGGVGFGGVNEE